MLARLLIALSALAPCGALRLPAAAMRATALDATRASSPVMLDRRAAVLAATSLMATALEEPA